MKSLIVLFCVFIFVHSQDEVREPKFFFGPKAHTVVAYRQVPEVVTEFVPSSCIVMEPTLPPCRHVRNLEIYPSTPTRIEVTQAPKPNFNKPKDVPIWNKLQQSGESINKVATPPLRGQRPQQIKTHSPYWNWHFFNPFRVQNVTYTETKTEYITTKVEDPHTVVSFYIKGCRPSKLPFDLNECDKPVEIVPEEFVQVNVQPAKTKPEENKSIVVMAPLKFVATVDEGSSKPSAESSITKNQALDQQKLSGESEGVSGDGEVEVPPEGENRNENETEIEHQEEMADI